MKLSDLKHKYDVKFVFAKDIEDDHWIPYITVADPLDQENVTYIREDFTDGFVIVHNSDKAYDRKIYLLDRENNVIGRETIKK